MHWDAGFGRLFNLTYRVNINSQHDIISFKEGFLKGLEHRFFLNHNSKFNPKNFWKEFLFNGNNTIKLMEKININRFVLNNHNENCLSFDSPESAGNE